METEEQTAQRIKKQEMVGKHVYALRTSDRMTVQELADKCLLSVSTIRRLESGEARLRPIVLKALADAFDVDAAYFSRIDKPETTEYHIEVKVPRPLAERLQREMVAF